MGQYQVFEVASVLSFQAASVLFYEKKEEIWSSSMTKAPTLAEKLKGQSDNTNNATKKFDYTAVADRLRTVSNYGHQTGVVNLVYGPNLPNNRNSRVIKRKHLRILWKGRAR